jgi:hypothetical protein
MDEVAMSPPVVTVPERNKRPGVCYALTSDGIELPVIDLTHPAFSGLPDRVAQERATGEYLGTMARQERAPAVVRRAAGWLMGRRSRLVRAIRDSGGTYLSGLDTYLLKLGPDNLGGGHSTRLDRVVAGTLPAMSARLRLRNMACLIAEALAPSLEARPGDTLRMVNIAGGPAMDCLNALLFLRRDRPTLLANRSVHIHLLDVDDAGAAFGARALDALLADGGPLAGLRATMDYSRYDWTESRSLLGRHWGLEQDIVACSSEGGLFEYGEDDAIVANLEALRRLVPEGTPLVGSVTREGPLTEAGRRSGLPQATHPRSIEGFAALAARGGWEVDRLIENLMTFDIRLR